MDRLIWMLAGLVRGLAGLLGELRRDWVRALLAETDDLVTGCATIPEPERPRRRRRSRNLAHAGTRSATRRGSSAASSRRPNRPPAESITPDAQPCSVVAPHPLVHASRRAACVSVACDS
jgi:hypothetical protein